MQSNEEKTTYTVLVTGANSGLGFATCCRLIDEFLFTRPQSQTLHLIITTRDRRKNDDTLLRLKKHLQKTLRAANGKTLGISLLLEPRIHLDGELLDLTSLSSVKALATRLLEREITHIDVLVLNAGIGGWSGMSWPSAIWAVLTDIVQATTYPTYKLGYTGRVVKPQLQEKGHEQRAAERQGQEDTEPALGEVFTANVFGHYMLAHLLMPLLAAPSASASILPGRIIWLSSIEAYAHSLHATDLQGLETSSAYESSKRLTDLLALTSELPSTRPSVSRFLQTAPGQEARQPRMYLCHPGICGTSIVDLPLILQYCMMASFFIARWLGSPWHAIWPYVGAVAPVWLALTPQTSLDGLEADGAKAKWGSATDQVGSERVIRTEVDGWGWSGSVGERADGSSRTRKGRWRGMKDLTQESRVEFEVAGQRVWKEMEELRGDWEQRLGWSDGAGGKRL